MLWFTFYMRIPLRVPQKHSHSVIYACGRVSSFPLLQLMKDSLTTRPMQAYVVSVYFDGKFKLTYEANVFLYVLSVCFLVFFLLLHVFSLLEMMGLPMMAFQP